MVDVAHDRHDRRTRARVSSFSSSPVRKPSSTSLSETRLTVWPKSVAISSAVSASSTSLIVIIAPWRIMNLIMSTARMAIRWARSWTVMASGMTTSRTTRLDRRRRRPWRASRVPVHGPGGPRPAERIRSAGILVAGDGLDGQPAFAALGRALAAGQDALGGRGGLAARAARRRAPSSSSPTSDAAVRRRAAGPCGWSW